MVHGRCPLGSALWLSDEWCHGNSWGGGEKADRGLPALLGYAARELFAAVRLHLGVRRVQKHNRLASKVSVTVLLGFGSIIPFALDLDRVEGASDVIALVLRHEFFLLFRRYTYPEE